MSISAVSIDMFQTLIDVDDRVDHIWKSILEDEYSQELVPHLVEEYYKFYSKIMKSIYEKSEFTALKTIFTYVFSEVKLNNNCNFKAERAAEILIEEHSNACFFSDATYFLNQWTNDLELWISSDADHLMIDPILSKFKFDRKFISEDIKAYKQDKQDRFFKKIVSETNINANEIIHIGDSHSDIIGAKRVGIKACWLNRKNVKWIGEYNPDYIISSLTELPELLQKVK